MIKFSGKIIFRIFWLIRIPKRTFSAIAVYYFLNYDIKMCGAVLHVVAGHSGQNRQNLQITPWSGNFASNIPILHWLRQLHMIPGNVRHACMISSVQHTFPALLLRIMYTCTDPRARPGALSGPVQLSDHGPIGKRKISKISKFQNFKISKNPWWSWIPVPGNFIPFCTNLWLSADWFCRTSIEFAETRETYFPGKPKKNRVDLNVFYSMAFLFLQILTSSSRTGDPPQLHPGKTVSHPGIWPVLPSFDRSAHPKMPGPPGVFADLVL